MPATAARVEGTLLLLAGAAVALYLLGRWLDRPLGERALRALSPGQ